MLSSLPGGGGFRPAAAIRHTTGYMARPQLICAYGSGQPRAGEGAITRLLPHLPSPTSIASSPSTSGMGLMVIPEGPGRGRSSRRGLGSSSRQAVGRTGFPAAMRDFFPGGLRGDEPVEASPSPARPGIITVSSEDSCRGLIGGTTRPILRPSIVVSAKGADRRRSRLLHPSPPLKPDGGATLSSRAIGGIPPSSRARRTMRPRGAYSHQIVPAATIVAAATPVLRTRTSPLHVARGQTPKTPRWSALEQNHRVIAPTADLNSARLRDGHTCNIRGLHPHGAHSIPRRTETTDTDVLRATAGLVSADRLGDRVRRYGFVQPGNPEFDPPDRPGDQHPRLFIRATRRPVGRPCATRRL